MYSTISFTFGFITGAYIAQNYNIPNVGGLIRLMVNKIDEYEKNNKKK